MEKIIEKDQALALMNVESSSQILPIIEEKPIRLFGKEFGGVGGGDSTSTMIITNMSESIDSNPFCDEPETNTMNPVNKYVKNIEASTRKYECHYCFRSFPTSQALGGHQNAHKKERQNAKRAQFQSPIVHETNIYGITNYHHGLGEAATRTNHHSTWTNINNSTPPPRFYRNGHHVNVISPLAFWKIPPPVHQSNSSSSCSNLPFSTSPMVKSTSTNCESNFVYEPKGDQVQDHVSLDLHL